MKKILCACFLLLCVMVLYAKGIREDIQLADEKVRLSYALGLVVGSDFEPGVLLDLDYTAFAEGMKTAIEKGEAKLSEDEAFEMVRTALEKAMAEQNAENRRGEEEFLSANGTRPEVRTTASGLQYEALAEGEGPLPGPADTVRVNYEGTLVDGTIFDSSYERGESEDFPLNQVIPGWAEGLRLMKVGSKYRLYIPSGLAYGAAGTGPIPPYATLIFTVELLEINQASEADPDSGETDTE
jgi:FKBP-type peptidyl-prolyl cis-trans isomerase